ncbi:hypothetical protein GN109_25340 [Collimonas pratensis]|uniref:hypothetical protein n=1 Tax=Collimonas pratensis TaxID=279113 RepID=UPI00143DFDBE|nr:hypothetical protein [Collimonas pratensis]NKI72749.1 hypothetical protein [Collimonas pratensis]
MEPEFIGGAYFSCTEPVTWDCCASYISFDSQRLARVYQVPDSFFRVLGYVKIPGAPQWIGEWWAEEHRVQVGSIGEAEQLAQGFLVASE